jgi:hypothetical protein
MKPSWSIFDCRQLVSFQLPLTARLSLRRAPSPRMPFVRSVGYRRGQLIDGENVPLNTSVTR